MVLKAFAGAIDDVPEDVTEALEGQSDLLHKLMKLAQWTETPTKSSNVLQLFEHSMTLCAETSFFKDMRENTGADEVDETRCRTLAKLKKSFTAIQEAIAKLPGGTLAG